MSRCNQVGSVRLVLAGVLISGGFPQQCIYVLLHPGFQRAASDARLTRVIIGVAVHLRIVLLFNKLFCIFISNFLCPSFLLS